MEEAPVRWPHGMTPAGLCTCQSRPRNASDGLTIVVHCLFEPPETLTEHLRVDVHNFNSGLSVSIGFSCVIEDTECNVACSSGDVDATNGTFATRSQSGDKGVFPQPVYAHRCRVVHQVVVGRYAVEHAFYEGFFGFFGDCSEAE